MVTSNITEHNPLKLTLAKCKLMFKYVLVFGCILNMLMLATPIYSMQVLDRVISSGNLDTLFMLTLVIGLALGLMSLLQAARSFAMLQMGAWIEKQLSEGVFSCSVRMSLESKVNIGSQQLRDLQTIKTYMTSLPLLTILDTPWAIIFIIALFIIHIYMGALAVIGGVILVGFAILSDRLTKPLHDANNEGFIKSMKHVDQATRNAEVIEVMGFLNNIIKSWQKVNTHVQGVQALVGKRQSVLTEITKFIRMFLQVLVTGIGAYLVINNEMSTGAIIASSSLIGRALAPFEQAIASWKGFVNCRKAYERLSKSYEVTEKVENRMELPAPEGKIDVENLYFAPQGVQKHIVKGVNFSLGAGEMLAIIGPSGSGKTTLAKLVVGGLQPSLGVVRVDDASLKDWKRNQLGQYIGYLPQDIELFGGTVKDNIARMDADASSEDVVIAAQIAGIHEMILQLPKGYDTEIGYDGSVLSGGQKQRLALARAFYGDPKILVLDEPNSNLDSSGEVALSTALSVAKERKMTCILISHRSSILSIVDKIMVLRDGGMVTMGKRDEVLSQLNKTQQVI
ncbi:type I secretion system permease/ATPase [Rickettsiales endosymbiont of Peranema trichophorum]|uniref:type I secretion system permease/ATPase n=1 Tax=Rickettsiales endosymbiont of Peranema trichophorum TaxID=2486577 RepID=UPI001023F15D|nr:type I secretion system permease/ATPase [Rickettsiales endosymbiont of Peranema trichophorum]RZI47781.1 type I secretion system permease/ATPase [Rickettsiales endosymbiont of Peranema trichophorum]